MTEGGPAKPPGQNKAIGFLSPCYRGKVGLRMPLAKIIEIASYPKCGNTWIRQLLANTFSLHVDFGIPEIHQQKDKSKYPPAKPGALVCEPLKAV